MAETEPLDLRAAAQAVFQQFHDGSDWEDCDYVEISVRALRNLGLTLAASPEPEPWKDEVFDRDEAARLGVTHSAPFAPGEMEPQRIEYYHDLIASQAAEIERLRKVVGLDKGGGR